MHSRFPAWLLLLGLVGSLLVAPASAQSSEDADERRIVAVGGSVTEVVFALGAGDDVVGVDASSIHPQAATEKPSVGYFRQLPAEGVLSLNPTLILALDGTGPPSVLDQLRSTGVRVEVIPDAPTVDGTAEKIRRVGTILGRETEADSLVRKMKEEMDEARALRAETDSTPRVLFIYARGSGSMNVAGSGSSAEAMIELAGGRNAISGFEGYKPMTPEAVAQAAPDVILMPSRGLESVGGIDGLLKQPGISLTPAGEARRIVAMDDLLLLGFTPRLGEAVLELTRKIHPDLPGSATSDAR